MATFRSVTIGQRRNKRSCSLSIAVDSVDQCNQTKPTRANSSRPSPQMNSEQRNLGANNNSLLTEQQPNQSSTLSITSDNDQRELLSSCNKITTSVSVEASAIDTTVVQINPCQSGSRVQVMINGRAAQDEMEYPNNQERRNDSCKWFFLLLLFDAESWDLIFSLSFKDQSDSERTGSQNILSLRTQYTITKMLLLISTVFIMLNLPR